MKLFSFDKIGIFLFIISFIFSSSIFPFCQIKEKVECKTTNINMNKNNYGDYYV